MPENSHGHNKRIHRIPEQSRATSRRHDRLPSFRSATILSKNIVILVHLSARWIGSQPVTSTKKIKRHCTPHCPFSSSNPHLHSTHSHLPYACLESLQKSLVGNKKSQATLDKDPYPQENPMSATKNRCLFNLPNERTPIPFTQLPLGRTF